MPPCGLKELKRTVCGCVMVWESEYGDSVGVDVMVLILINLDFQSLCKVLPPL